jgi:membrane protease YdiL (CAAX protease family)
MKYFRTYPWGFQLLLFGLMFFTLFQGMSVILLSLLPKMYGVTMVQIRQIAPGSPINLVNAAIFMQGFFNFCVYFLTAFLFSYLSHPWQREYLGLRAPGRNIHYLLAVTLMLGAMPVLTLISSLIGKIDFGPDVKAAQLVNDNIMRAFLDMPTFGRFIQMFFVMAIIPGIGEELFFRGVMMRFVKQRTASMVSPVLFTATFFALSHSDVYGIFPIFLAGALLAVIYNLTGSLWCSILAHILFNGSQITLSYLGNYNPSVKAFVNSEAISVPLVMAGAVVFGVSLYLLIKNKTPLRANWADNFTPEELQREENL